MKLLVSLVLSLSQFAWAQVETGTVIFADFEQDEITIAADSRTNINGNEKHDDTECKISAFGSKFIFSLAGIARRSDQWTASSVARQIWEVESKSPSDTALLNRVVDGWIGAMDKLYGDPFVITNLRKSMTEEPIVATAIFAAIDESGNLRMRTVDTSFDLALFDTTGRVKIIDKVSEMPVDAHGTMGHDEVAIEFRHQTSQRATEYMSWFATRIADLSVDQARAELASKYVELSILLHPKNNEMAFPIDVLQLRKGTGVHWVWRKPNCPAD